MTTTIQKGVLQADGSTIAPEATIDPKHRRGRRRLHGRPAVERKCFDHDRHGEQDALRRARLTGDHRGPDARPGRPLREGAARRGHDRKGRGPAISRSPDREDVQHGFGRYRRRPEILRFASRHQGRRRRDRGRRVRRPRRPVRLREIDAAAHDRGARAHLRRRDPDRRPRRQRPAAEGPGHRHGVPELRALSAHDGRREHGLLAEAEERLRSPRSRRG